MKIIVGLGNPGTEYENTRHNTGFLAIDKIFAGSRSLGYEFSDFTHDKKSNAEISQGMVGAEKVLLVKPQTFMNSSGESVGQLVNFYKLNPEEDILLIYDDIDLPLGEMKTTGTSAGGHNGVQSIFDHLNTESVQRIRIGTGTQEDIKDLKEYVLQKFSAEEKGKLDEVMMGSLTAIGNFLNIN